MAKRMAIITAMVKPTRVVIFARPRMKLGLAREARDEDDEDDEDAEYRVRTVLS